MPLVLPPHFKSEQRQLEGAGIDGWQQLADLHDDDLRQLGRSGGASEARLIKLRGQARLVVEAGVEPAEAALLLYAGIANCQGLAQANPHQLLIQMRRLQASLTGMAAPRLDLITLQSRIRRAQLRSARRATN
ncbi:MAG: DUF4332 domain-containing protein [Cyanobium sp. LacPavin_0920_WC12_MAG_62_9]|nr:DUF4332 domain-containing protein [Cyanobium sp. LacPavin_0920_WC12_MAG_62_9]